MSTERTQAIMDAYLKALVARGAYETFLAENVTFTLMGADQEVRGRAEVGQFIRYLHEQAFDAEPVVKRVLAGDGAAVLEADFVGTQIAPLNGVPSQGATVDVPYAVYYELDGDQITALRAYLPMDALMRQITLKSTTA
jgi:steroid delta-isomerase-like uncharacterized protein